MPSGALAQQKSPAPAVACTQMPQSEAARTVSPAPSTMPAAEASSQAEAALPMEATAKGVDLKSFKDHFVNIRKSAQALSEEKEEAKANDTRQLSRLASPRKIAISTLIAGTSGSLFFGASFLKAALIGLLFSITQSSIAMKVCKGDNRFSQKLMEASRKLNGEEQQSKGRTVASVWALVTGMMAFLEAGIIARVLGKGNPLVEKVIPKLQKFAFFQKGFGDAVIRFMGRHTTGLYLGIATLGAVIGGYLQAMLTMKLSGHSGAPTAQGKSLPAEAALPAK